ncbi:competence protein CoiA family protein [Streptomyces sp. NPDC004647]|uniref:competence protein CoiA family protein n=1 Tax=Streptomyces sp. NPDC004647 TaxID=3154671 RepID=UPI0033B4CE1D
MRDDLLVVGFDLESGEEVHVGERPAHQWHRLGFHGTRTLVCFYCFRGIDAPPGTRVALLVRGRTGGRVRFHFAHPPGRAPHGGHHPETVWHLTTKHLLARWARTQPSVTDVRLEQWTPEHTRRADVWVRLSDGSQLALEAQRALLPDHAWTARHRDYAAAGIRDVWLWLPGLDVPHVVFDHGLPVWFFRPENRLIGGAFGQPHPRTGRWWEAPDLSIYALHHPPCPRDRLDRLRIPLDQMSLDRDGLTLPDLLHNQLHTSQRETRESAETRRRGEDRWARELHAHRQAAAAKAPQTGQAPSDQEPRPRPAPGRPPARSRTPNTSRTGHICSTCLLPLDPNLARFGRHIGC